MGAAPFFLYAYDRNGAPINGAQINAYVKDTTTRQSVFTDAALTVPAANPATSDSAGRVKVYLNDAQSYSLDVKSADGSETLFQADYTTGDADPLIITYATPNMSAGFSDATIDAINTVSDDLETDNFVGITAGLQTELQALGPLSDDIAALYLIRADIEDVADINAETIIVAGIAGNVTTVAGISADITTTAGISANVSTVAGISADVTTVAGISADVTYVATNGADIRTDSEAARDLAQKWASEAEDTEVITNGYSAFHYSRKALASASLAFDWAEEDEDTEVTAGRYSAKHHALKSEGFKDEAEAAAADTAADRVATAADALKYPALKSQVDGGIRNFLNADADADVGLIGLHDDRRKGFDTVEIDGNVKLRIAAGNSMSTAATEAQVSDNTVLVEKERTDRVAAIGNVLLDDARLGGASVVHVDADGKAIKAELMNGSALTFDIPNPAYLAGSDTDADGNIIGVGARAAQFASTHLNICVCDSQSLGTGSGNYIGTINPVSDTNETASHYMLDIVGANGPYMVNFESPLNSEDLLPLRCSGDREVPIVGMARMIGDYENDNFGQRANWLFGAIGAGAQDISELWMGSDNFQRFINWLRYAVQVGRANGFETFSLNIIQDVHGEADEGLQIRAHEYAEAKERKFDEMQRVANEILNDDTQFVVVMSQTAQSINAQRPKEHVKLGQTINSANKIHPFQHTAQGMVELAMRDPLRFVVVDQYSCSENVSGDTVHLDPIGYRQLGEKTGYIGARALYETGTWKVGANRASTLMVRDAERWSDTQIMVDYRQPMQVTRDGNVTRPSYDDSASAEVDHDGVFLVVRYYFDDGVKVNQPSLIPVDAAVYSADSDKVIFTVSVADITLPESGISVAIAMHDNDDGQHAGGGPRSTLRSVQHAFTSPNQAGRTNDNWAVRQFYRVN